MTSLSTDLIRIEAEPRPTILVELVGVEYSVSPPKAALALKLSVHSKQAMDSKDPEQMDRAMQEWIATAFDPETAEKVRARLDDPRDALDMPHIGQLMRAVMEATTGNPTTSA